VLQTFQHLSQMNKRQTKTFGGEENEGQGSQKKKSKVPDFFDSGQSEANQTSKIPYISKLKWTLFNVIMVYVISVNLITAYVLWLMLSIL
jgi:hypothetical protein